MLDFLISVWHALRVRPGQQLVERAPLWGFVLYFLVNHYLNTAAKILHKWSNKWEHSSLIYVSDRCVPMSFKA